MEAMAKEHFDFEKVENFNGINVQIYDMQDNLILEKQFLTKEKYEKLDLPYLKWVDPIDKNYFVWREFFISKVYDNFLNKINIKTAIDLGANHGLFTHLLLIKGCEKIYVVEPLLKCCDSLKKNFDDRVVIINKAISKSTNVEIFYNNNNTALSYTDKEKENKHLSLNYETSTVEGISINKLFNEYSINNVDFLKVDIEGDEYELFEDIEESNLLKVDNLLIEFHHNVNDNIDTIIKRLKNNYSYEIEYTPENRGIIFASKK
jgi:FkbM family methyltransferase